MIPELYSTRSKNKVYNFFRAKKAVALSISVGNIKKEAVEAVATGRIRVLGNGLELA